MIGMPFPRASKVPYMAVEGVSGSIIPKFETLRNAILR